MAMSAGRFDNVFNRLNTELDRMLRIGVPKTALDNIRKTLLEYRPLNEIPVPAVSITTTPYQVTFNRFEAYKRGEFTWEFVLKAWDECSREDQIALNELFQGE